MKIKELIEKNRSYRRFYQNHTIEISTLKELVNLARLSASGANLQPLKYILSNELKKNNMIFKHLSWAGYLKNWSGPKEKEKPSAYIIILGDTNISKTFGCDHGIASQSILLGATEKGLGGCIIGSINRKELMKDLKILPDLDILLVIALGKPKEEVKIVNIYNTIEYWRDSNGVHYVPKRNLNDIILEGVKNE